MIDNSKEYIICAAIWFMDGKVHEHQPNNIESGFVICGRRHHNCFITMSILKGKDLKKSDYGKNIQGFLTSKDRFIDRRNAGNYALEMGQITRATDCLFSEDLY